MQRPHSQATVSHGMVPQSWCLVGGCRQSQVRGRGPAQEERMESNWRGNEKWQETRCTWGLGQKVLDGWQEHQLSESRVDVSPGHDRIDAGRCPVNASLCQVQCSCSWVMDSNSSRSWDLLLSCQNPAKSTCPWFWALPSKSLRIDSQCLLPSSTSGLPVCYKRKLILCSMLVFVSPLSTEFGSN